jgi:hypothetical protein
MPLIDKPIVNVIYVEDAPAAEDSNCFACYETL